MSQTKNFTLKLFPLLISFIVICKSSDSPFSDPLYKQKYAEQALLIEEQRWLMVDLDDNGTVTIDQTKNIVPDFYWYQIQTAYQLIDLDKNGFDKKQYLVYQFEYVPQMTKDQKVIQQRQKRLSQLSSKEKTKNLILLIKRILQTKDPQFRKQKIEHLAEKYNIEKSLSYQRKIQIILQKLQALQRSLNESSQL